DSAEPSRNAQPLRAPSARRRSRSQADQTGLGRQEAAGPQVEGPQVLLEVDVQPLATRRLRLLARHPHEASPDAGAAHRGRDHHVLEPGVRETVPEHVREADEHAARPRTRPPQAVSLTETAPVPFVLGVDARLEALRVERIDLAAPEGSSPRDLHARDDRASTRSLPWTGRGQPIFSASSTMIPSGPRT